jgi:3-phosphoshikimate 1-carboxyvinyltransferase
MNSVLLPSSKSLWNRYQILGSFSQSLSLQANNPGTDVLELKRALQDLKEGAAEFELGLGGTSLRFFLARVSREPGVFRVRAHPGLLKRPLAPLCRALQSLGVKIELFADHVRVESQGWQEPKGPLIVESVESSQFASAILLASLELNFELALEVRGDASSEYFRMSVQAWESLTGQSWAGVAPKGSALRPKLEVGVEGDWSSAWSVVGACLGKAFKQGSPGASVQLRPLHSDSTQPDATFQRLLEFWGLPFRFNADLRKESLEILSFPSRWKAVDDFDLGSSPDLFPVLASVLALAKGRSQVRGVRNLVFKESNRCDAVLDLLGRAGFLCGCSDDLFWVEGQSAPFAKAFDFDPRQDHRMAMAAAVLMAAGWPIQLRDREVVSKSFPGFWETIE